MVAPLYGLVSSPAPTQESTSDLLCWAVHTRGPLATSRDVIPVQHLLSQQTHPHPLSLPYSLILSPSFLLPHYFLCTPSSLPLSLGSPAQVSLTFLGGSFFPKPFPHLP